METLDRLGCISGEKEKNKCNVSGQWRIINWKYIESTCFKQHVQRQVDGVDGVW